MKKERSVQTRLTVEIDCRMEQLYEYTLNNTLHACLRYVPEQVESWDH